MTPQEKAKELVAKYYTSLHNSVHGFNHEQAKKCAIISVEEIRKFWNQEAYPLTHYSKWSAYLKQVKTEINNL